MIRKRPKRTVDSGMDEPNEMMTIKVSIAPWFSVLAGEMAQAGNNAMRLGVEPGLVLECVIAALRAVVPEAVTLTEPRAAAP